MKQYIKKAVFFLFLALLVVPLLQFKFGLIKMNPLGGEIQTTPRPTATLDRWISMDYQQTYEKYINDNLGFREFFIRAYNQVWFTLFGKLHARDVIMGKNNILYERNYIEDYTGLNFRGEDSIRIQLQRVKYLQDTLSKENVHLILYFAPGKASFFPDEIPEAFLQKAKRQTNYKVYTSLCKEIGLDYIDMNAWFVANKATSHYPLYKQGGIHWTVYGMTLAFDSLNHYMGHKQGAPLPELHTDGIEWSDTARETDNDIEKGLNLLFDIPYGQYAYPIVSWKEGPNTKKPRVMVVADSYWWNVFGSGYTIKSYNGSSFWFYNKEVYYDNGAPKTAADTLKLYNEVQKTDFIIILATEANLRQFGYGFIERLYDLYSGKGDPISDKIRINKELLEEEKNIRGDDNWMNLIRQKAKDTGMPVDTIVRQDAKYMLDQRKKK